MVELPRARLAGIGSRTAARSCLGKPRSRRRRQIAPRPPRLAKLAEAVRSHPADHGILLLMPQAFARSGSRVSQAIDTLRRGQAVVFAEAGAALKVLSVELAEGSEEHQS